MNLFFYFEIAGVFDIMPFDNMLQKINCDCPGSMSLPTRVIESSSH